MLCHTEQMKVNFVKNNNTLTSLHDSLISVWHSFSYLSFKSFFFFNITCRLLLLPSADLQKKIRYNQSFPRSVGYVAMCSKRLFITGPNDQQESQHLLSGVCECSVNLMLGPVIHTPLLDRMSIQLQLTLRNVNTVSTQLTVYLDEYRNLTITIGTKL